MTTESGPQTITNLRVTIAAGVVTVVGLVMLIASGTNEWLLDDTHAAWRDVASQVGSLVLVSGIATLYWDLRGKRDLITEVLARVALKEDVEVAGLTAVSVDYRTVPWGDYIDRAKKIDLFMAYGQSWRKTYWPNLERFAGKSSHRLRLFLPDPHDTATVELLSKRFKYEFHVTRGLIEEMATAMAALSKPNGAKIEIYYRAGDPTFTLYKFDDLAVATLYSNTRKRGSVPTFTVRGGTLGEFFDANLEDIKVQSTAVAIADLMKEGK